MTPSLADHQYMARAIQSARKGLYTTNPNPRVACVLVKDGQIVGEGYHQKAGEPHAERLAIQDAGEQASGAMAYVTLEPCCHQGRTPACTDGLLAAGVQRVFAAMQDPNPEVAGQGIQQLRDAGVEVHVGLLQQDAQQLNPGFIKRMREGLPYVRLKMAMSLDGRTAMANWENQWSQLDCDRWNQLNRDRWSQLDCDRWNQLNRDRWITGEPARADVQHWRARSSAVVTGIGTVLADNPSLNVRLAETNRQPLRVVLDSQARTPVDATLLHLPGKVVFFVGEQAAQNQCAALMAAGADVQPLALDSTNRLPLEQVMRLLASQYEANEVLLECGATLAGAALQAGIVDELVVYMAPHLMGSTARGLVDLPGVGKMDQRIQLQLKETRQIGDDLRMTYSVMR